jgi:hypothetical protein
MDPRSRAAAEKEPLLATAWKARRRRRSYIDKQHKRYDNLRCVDELSAAILIRVVRGISQVLIEVEDLDRALSFWTGPTGFELEGNRFALTPRDGT